VNGGKGRYKGVGISVKLPPSLLEQMDKLVEAGIFGNRSDVIREAVRQLIIKYYSLDSERPVLAVR